LPDATSRRLAVELEALVYRGPTGPARDHSWCATREAQVPMAMELASPAEYGVETPAMECTVRLPGSRPPSRPCRPTQRSFGGPWQPPQPAHPRLCAPKGCSKTPHCKPAYRSAPIARKLSRCARTRFEEWCPGRSPKVSPHGGPTSPRRCAVDPFREELHDIRRPPNTVAPSPQHYAAGQVRQGSGGGCRLAHRHRVHTTRPSRLATALAEFGKHLIKVLYLDVEQLAHIQGRQG
jgi:hypothetical protein